MNNKVLNQLYNLNKYILDYTVVHMLALSQVDYGFGLLTLQKTQLNRLDVFQNEGMRAILGWTKGCTKGTAAAAMRHVLGYCTMQERHKPAQVKA